MSTEFRSILNLKQCQDRAMSQTPLINLVSTLFIKGTLFISLISFIIISELLFSLLLRFNQSFDQPSSND